MPITEIALLFLFSIYQALCLYNTLVITLPSTYYPDENCVSKCLCVSNWRAGTR